MFQEPANDQAKADDQIDSKGSLQSLPNRTTMMDAKEVQSLSLNGDLTPVAAVMLDVGGVGVANDVLGKQEVDQYLEYLATELKQHFSEGAVVRWGGDEFAVLLPVHSTEAIVDQIEAFPAETVRDRFLEDSGCRERWEQANDVLNYRNAERAFVKGREGEGIEKLRESMPENIGESDAEPCLGIHRGSIQHLGANFSIEEVSAAIGKSEQRVNLSKSGSTDALLLDDEVRNRFNESLKAIDDAGSLDLGEYTMSDRSEKASEFDKNAHHEQSEDRDINVVDLNSSEDTEDKNPLTEAIDSSLSESALIGRFNYEVLRLDQMTALPAETLDLDKYDQMIMVNLDQFGSINKLGMECADQTLKKVASQLAELSYSANPHGESLIVRTSGGELVMFSDETIETDKLKRAAIGIQREVSQVLKEVENDEVNVAILDALIKNDVRAYAKEHIPEVRGSGAPEGLADIYLSHSQVAGNIPGNSEASVGEVFSEVVRTLHSSSDKMQLSLFGPQDPGHLDSKYNDIDQKEKESASPIPLKVRGWLSGINRRVQENMGNRSNILQKEDKEATAEDEKN